VVLTEGQEEAAGKEAGVRLWGGPVPPSPSPQCGGAPRQKSRSQGGDSRGAGRQTEGGWSCIDTLTASDWYIGAQINRVKSN